MRVKEIVLGIAAVASAAVLAACSSGTTAQSANAGVHLAAGNAAATTPTTTTVETTTPPTTTPPSTMTPLTMTPLATHSATPQLQSAPETQAAAPAYAAGIPCHLSSGACASLSAHRVWIVRNGQVIFSAPIEPGTRSYPTPTGTFHVLSKVVNYHSHEFNNALMKYSTFFYPGDAFHVGSLSIPSHGCVHMTYSGAQTLFNDLSIGDVVQIVG